MDRIVPSPVDELSTYANRDTDSLAPGNPNTPPVANNDTATTPVNTAVLIPVLANDTAASRNPIDPKSVKVREKAE